MAAASQQKYLTVKLGFLTERRDQLFSVVNDQVNKVLDLGKSWMEGKRENDDGKVLSYKEISCLVEDTDMLLAQQVEQLAGGDQEYVVTDTSSAATTTSSSLVTVAASQTSADTETLKSAMARIQIMEKAFSSLSDTVDKQQVDFDTLKDHMEGEMTKKLEDVAEKMVKQEKSGKRINKVEQRLGALEERETEYIEKLETIEKKLAREKIKRENLEAVQNQRERKLEAVERKFDQMETSNISLSSKVDDQESSIQELTTTVKTHSVSLENQTSSIQELTTKVETEAIKLTRIHNKVRVLKREKNTALKNVEKQLEEVTLNYQMVCQIVADRLLPLEKLREILNNKVKNSHENVQKLHTVIQDVADLVPKVSHLENQIQQTTTPTVAARDMKLKTVIQDVADLVPKVSHLENQIQQTITPTLAVGAGVVHITPVKGNIIDKWRRVASNTGGHFDVNTGIFTAPVAGTYAVALSMWQKNEGKIVLWVKKTPSGSNPSVDNDKYVAVAITDRHESTNCDFSVVDMSVGDKFYVCVWHVDKSPTLGGCRFSIFLVK